MAWTEVQLKAMARNIHSLNAEEARQLVPLLSIETQEFFFLLFTMPDQGGKVEPQRAQRLLTDDFLRRAFYKADAPK